jgi:hypothetical protein
VFGFDDGKRSYRQPGQGDGAMVMNGWPHHPANADGGILGFLARMFAGWSWMPSDSSSGYLQPPQMGAVPPPVTLGPGVPPGP